MSLGSRSSILSSGVTAKPLAYPTHQPISFVWMLTKLVLSRSITPTIRINKNEYNSSSTCTNHTTTNAKESQIGFDIYIYIYTHQFSSGAHLNPKP